MRPIKFRYWDEVIKQFVYSNDFDLETELFRLQAFFEKASKYSYSRIIQQFTGRVDKNGKEIYEGDIVSWLNCAPWDENVPIRVKGIIKFKIGRWWIDSSEISDDLYEIEEVTVIGNVFETPKLIT